MGSSARKKKEKKKDFQKPKLKVGKARPKAANQTDTSFRSKAIVLNQQLHTAPPSTESQIAHHVSLLSSRSDSQRRDSLAYLTSLNTSRPPNSSPRLPVGEILPKLYPLLVDRSDSVRQQTLKLLRSLTPDDISGQMHDIMPWIRAGMTHLSTDIRLSALEALSWLLDVAGLELVSCEGGWVKTLNCFLALLGWHTEDKSKWSSSRACFARVGNDGNPQAKYLQSLAKLMDAGLGVQKHHQSQSGEEEYQHPVFPFWQVERHLIPQKPNPYRYLNLYGTQQDADSAMFEYREERKQIYDERFASSIEKGLASARKEAGEVGRAAGLVAKALKGT